MNLLPYKKYTLSTKLTPEEIAQKLSEQIEPVDNYRFMRFVNTYYNTKPYEGTVSNNKFTMRRISMLNYKYPTIVKGTILEQPDGAEVHIVIRLGVVILFFMCLFSFVITFCIFEVVREIVKSIPGEPAVLFFF